MDPRELLTGTSPGPWYVNEAVEPPFGPGGPTILFVDSAKTFIASTHLSPDALRALPDAELLAAAPDLAARVIALEDGIKDLIAGAHGGWVKVPAADLRALLDGEDGGMSEHLEDCDCDNCCTHEITEWGNCVACGA